MIYSVVITDQALSRIEEQARYIAIDAKAPLTAARWLSKVLAATETLSTMPRRCPTAPEHGHHPFEIRAFDIDGFLLIFTVNDDDRTVQVLNARHGRQLPRPDEISSPDRETGSV